MAYDVARVRGLYPALGEGFVHLDGAAGTQVAGTVAEAVAATMRTAVSNRSTVSAPSRRSGELVAGAREAAADLLGAPGPEGVVLGPSATTLTYAMARTLAAGWGSGDEVVVSRLDHDANIRPWLQVAERAGATVRWAEPDLERGTLPVEQYDELVTERTRLVAVTAASNAIGTRPDVRAIADRAHAAGALVYVDGVHATAHDPVDMAALGADLYVASAYKWSGPHLAVVAGDPALLETLRPDKLLPSPDAVPERFETGTGCFELYAGLTAAVDHLAGLDPEATGSRRERLLASVGAARAYEETVFAPLYAGLCAMDGVTVYGHAEDRCPTVSFRVDGRSPLEVATALGERRVCVFAGDYYAAELFTALGLRESGGAVRASLYHYSTVSEVDALLAAVADLVG